jgi:hypothetical protein
VIKLLHKFYSLYEASDLTSFTRGDFVKWGITGNIKLAILHTGCVQINKMVDVWTDKEDTKIHWLDNDFLFVKKADLIKLYSHNAKHGVQGEDKSIRVYSFYLNEFDGVMTVDQKGGGEDISISYNSLYILKSDLKELILNYQEHPERASVDHIILDEEHEWHANELRIAYLAWLELYGVEPPESKPSGGHKNFIISWLKKNHPQLSQNALERIATVVNPNPSGGASPTPEKF